MKIDLSVCKQSIKHCITEHKCLFALGHFHTGSFSAPHICPVSGYRIECIVVKTEITFVEKKKGV